MNPVDLALALAFLVVWPLYGARFGTPFLKASVAAGVPGARRAEYGTTILMLWMFAGLGVAAALEHGLSARALRLLPPAGIVPIAISLAALAAIVVLLGLQDRTLLSAAGRAAVRRAGASLSWFLPQDRADQVAFRGLSVTAGVCEEWLVRGWLLAVLAPLAGTARAAFLSSAMFGIAHAYQGPKGILKTGLVGLIMAGLAWATGSIWAPIVIHALIDWKQGDLFVRAYAPEEPVEPVAGGAGAGVAAA